MACVNIVSNVGNILVHLSKLLRHLSLNLSQLLKDVLWTLAKGQRSCQGRHTLWARFSGIKRSCLATARKYWNIRKISEFGGDVLEALSERCEIRPWA